MEQLWEIKLDWKNMKCMQIFKKRGGGNSKFNIQGNKKEKFLNFVMLCATS